MNRRNFITTGAVAGAASLAGCSPATEAAKSEAAPAAGKPIAMHVGCQSGPTDAQRLQFFKRHGVDHICGYPPRPEGRGHWTVEEVVKTRELCEQHGVELSMVGLPFLTSSHIDREKRGAIMLGQSPERDRDIEDVHKMIEACAKAGVPAFKYNMSLLGVVRTERTPGRGGSTYSTWRLAEAKPEPPLTRAGVVNADEFWERITYFLDRVIPVANEFKVRAACHPHDPGMPPEGYQGIDRVLGTPEGLYKFMKIQESPYHGFNLCLGTTAEMLQDPNREIHGVIREIGSAKKIFNIHFRNIRGKRDSFSETYPDEGDMNMVEVAQTLREVEYPYMLMPDHVPQHPDDPRGNQGFAFAYGHIKGILQTLKTVS